MEQELAYSFHLRSDKDKSKLASLKDRKKNNARFKNGGNLDIENKKVKNLIDMINDMDLTNKLILSTCMSNSSCTNLKYDKPEMYARFDNMLKKLIWNIELH